MASTSCAVGSSVLSMSATACAGLSTTVVVVTFCSMVVVVVVKTVVVAVGAIVVDVTLEGFTGASVVVVAG